MPVLMPILHRDFFAPENIELTFFTPAADFQCDREFCRSAKNLAFYLDPLMWLS
jgi:hypothetical protein